MSLCRNRLIENMIWSSFARLRAIVVIACNWGFLTYVGTYF